MLRCSSLRAPEVGRIYDVHAVDSRECTRKNGSRPNPGFVARLRFRSGSPMALCRQRPLPSGGRGATALLNVRVVLSGLDTRYAPALLSRNRAWPKPRGANRRLQPRGYSRQAFPARLYVARSFPARSLLACSDGLREPERMHQGQQEDRDRAWRHATCGRLHLHQEGLLLYFSC